MNPMQAAAKKKKKDKTKVKNRPEISGLGSIDPFENPSTAGEDPNDLTKLTVAQLKEMLRVHKMKVSGKKAELIARLQGN